MPEITRSFTRRIPRSALRTWLAVVAGTVAVAGCESSKGLTAPEDARASYGACGPIVNVWVTGSSNNTVIQNHSITYTAAAYDAQGCKAVTQFYWSSENPSVAQVTPSGATAQVTGVGVGFTNIRVTAAGITGVNAVQVVAQVPSRVETSPASWYMQPNETVQLSATVFDQAGQVIFGAPVSWTTDNAAVASVSSSGLATGVGSGATTVRATAGGVQGTSTLNIRYAVEVDVRGPEHVEYAGDYTYTAAVTGGVGGYTYAWFVYRPQTGWTQMASTTSQVTIYIGEGEGEAQVRAIVQSGGVTGEGFKFTTNGIGCGGDYCPIEW